MDFPVATRFILLLRHLTDLLFNQWTIHLLMLTFVWTLIRLLLCHRPLQYSFSPWRKVCSASSFDSKMLLVLLPALDISVVTFFFWGFYFLFLNGSRYRAWVHDLLVHLSVFRVPSPGWVAISCHLGTACSCSWISRILRRLIGGQYFWQLHHWAVLDLSVS